MTDIKQNQTGGTMEYSLTRRRALVLGASAAGAVVGAGIKPASAATSWSAYTYVPVGTVPSVQGLQMIIDQFTKVMGGDFRVQLHLAGSLPIEGTNITQAVSENIVQLADDGLTTGNIPIIGVLRLPMLMASASEMNKALNVMAPTIEAAYDKKNCVVLGQHIYPAQVIFGHKKIASIEDIAGKKLRVSSVEQGVFVKTFGGVPITMSPQQVAPALEEGVIDGAITASSGGAMGLQDLLPWRFALPTSFLNASYIVNKSAFNALTQDQQAALLKIGANAAAWSDTEFEQREKQVTAQFVAGGMHNVIPTQAEISLAVEKMQPYWPQWAAAHGADAQAALAKIRAAVGR